FYSYSMEPGEDFWLQYSNNGGSTWTTVAQWVNGTHFNNNTFYYTTKSINKSVYGFTNNSKFRIVCDASTNSDLVYIDAVKVKGLATATMPGESTESMVALSSIFEDVVDGVKVFPNPVRSELNVLIPAEREGETIVNMYDAMGRKIIARPVLEGEHKVMLDVTGLRTGFYIVSILVDGEISHTEKVSVITGD
ncbi:MAG TPA: T9SS type A sorting domain-containing protein, partial [Saprospiraceae bacterium]|nr:T9SS type A sorting domain-containing protein [Saprospiraceae bacterium]